MAFTPFTVTYSTRVSSESDSKWRVVGYPDLESQSIRTVRTTNRSNSNDNKPRRAGHTKHVITINAQNAAIAFHKHIGILRVIIDNQVYTHAEIYWEKGWK